LIFKFGQARRRCFREALFRRVKRESIVAKTEAIEFRLTFIGISAPRRVRCRKQEIVVAEGNYLIIIVVREFNLFDLFEKWEFAIINHIHHPLNHT